MNEAAALVILAMWLLGGRGFNLCFAIFVYYVAYISLDYTLFSVSYFTHVDAVLYYLVQAWLDVAMIAIILTILANDIKIMALQWGYAAIIGTSLICDSMMAVNVQISFDWLYYLHTIRNTFSIPLDVVFAFAGSGLIAKLPSFCVRLRTS